MQSLNPETGTNVYKSVIWIARIIAAVLLVVTIHYIGFFSTLSENYFGVMTPSLVNRVTWELVSILAFTSLLTAVFLMVEGIIKGVAYGITGALRKLKDTPTPSYAVDPFRIFGCYLAVILVKYFPAEVSFFRRTVYFVFAMIAAGAIYFVFFHKHSPDSTFDKLFRPLRKPEIAVRASIAVALSTSYLMGMGLAWSIAGEKPIKIDTNDGDIMAVIIDNTDAGLLIIREGSLYFLPMHTIRKVTWKDAN